MAGFAACGKSKSKKSYDFAGTWDICVHFTYDPYDDFSDFDDRGTATVSGSDITIDFGVVVVFTRTIDGDTFDVTWEPSGLTWRLVGTAEDANTVSGNLTVNEEGYGEVARGTFTLEKV